MFVVRFPAIVTAESSLAVLHWAERLIPLSIVVTFTAGKIGPLGIDTLTAFWFVGGYFGHVTMLGASHVPVKHERRTLKRGH